MRDIKIYGLQRSGTNYLEKLMMENYNVGIHTNKGGWKHGKYMKSKMIQAFGEEIGCLVISKNVYSWLWSAFNHWPDKDFFPFIKKLLYRYSDYHRNWLDIKNHIQVKYEKLIVNTEEVCDLIAEHFSAERKSGDFVNYQRRVGKALKMEKAEFDKGFYLGKKYLKNFTKEMDDYVKSNTDISVVKKLGYDPVTLL